MGQRVEAYYAVLFSITPSSLPLHEDICRQVKIGSVPLKTTTTAGKSELLSLKSSRASRLRPRLSTTGGNRRSRSR